jgi:hypothetical protein
MVGMGDDNKDITIHEVFPGEEEDFTMYEAEEGYGTNHGSCEWDMDEEEPLFILELAEAERMAAREFPSGNGDTEAKHHTSAV